MKQLLEALDLALEALATEEYRLRQIGQSQVYPGIGFAITAIKQARSAPVQEPSCPECVFGLCHCGLRDTPPAAPVQEPVAVDCCANCLRPEREHQDGKCPKPFTTVWHAWDYDFPPDAPPAAQRQWVGLTDEEIEPYYAANKPLIKWVEAKLKEKNT
jgi:hypothetical protein